MRLLLVKMLRDMKKSLGAYLICAFVIAIGFCGYSLLSISRDDVVSARDNFCKEENFADGFASVKKAPKSLERKLAAIPGVKTAKGRIVKEARILSFSGEKVELKLVSIEDNDINGVSVMEGRLPYRSEKSICTSNKFFDARGLKLYDSLRFTVENRQVELKVVGKGISPEFIYVIKTIQDILPNPMLYEVGFARYEVMASLFNMNGLANDFVFKMQDGVPFDSVKDEIEKTLEPYGVITVYPKDKQLSYSLVSQKMNGVDKSVNTIPFLFLSISSIILYIMLKRLIEQQRTQIGVFKALGFSSGSIISHFVLYGSIVGFVGGAFGGSLGSYLAKPMTELYRFYYNIPSLEGSFSVKYLIIGIVISTAVSSFAAYRATKGILHLSPSDALRPVSPSFKGTTPIERATVIYNLFTTQGRMALRNLFRNGKRSLLTTLGVVSAFTLMATLLSVYTLYDVFLFDYYTKMQLQDVRIGFSRPVLEADAVRAVATTPIELSEPVTEVGATLGYGAKKEDLGIIALKPGATLFKLYDERGTPISLSADGIVISTHLSHIIGANIGDMVEVGFTYPKKSTVLVRVDAIAAQYLGSNAYMSFESLARISPYKNAATSLYVKGGQDSLKRLVSTLDNADAVEIVEEKSETIAKYRAFMGAYNYSMFVIAILGVVTGFSVVYTSSLITFEELKKELATLKVLGMNSREILQVISTEHWIIAFISIAIGIPLTLLACRSMASSLETDLYTIPLTADPVSIIRSAIGILLAVYIANRVIHRKIVEIVPADTAKERE